MGVAPFPGMRNLRFKSNSSFGIALLCLTFGQSALAAPIEYCTDAFTTGKSFSLPYKPEMLNWAQANFSNPLKFNPKQYRFIVHAGPNIVAGEGDALTIFMQKIKTFDFNTESLFSASVVSEEQTATFSRAGVILSVPDEKIVASTPDDMRSHIGSEQTFAKAMVASASLFKREGLKSPQETIDRASHSTGFYSFDLGWTEVVIAGRAESTTPIVVTGLFTHQDSLGNVMLTDQRFEVMKTTAQEMKLPLIFFPPPKNEFVLKVKMSRSRETKAFGIWGPESLRFYNSEKEVRDIFRQADAAGKRVRLVDETSGPQNILASSRFLEGQWIIKNLVEVGRTKFQSPIYETQYVELKVEEQPSDLKPIKIEFKSVE